MWDSITRPVRAEINLGNIRYNLQQVRKNISADTLIMAVVKADAYGHGVIPVARAAVEAEADRLAVALPEEGRELREAGFELPIQILAETIPGQIAIVVENNLIATVASKNSVNNLDKLAEEKGIKQKVHIKVDTGMGRIGLQPQRALDFIEWVLNKNNIEIEGLMTHFAKADEQDKEYTYQQWGKFNYVIKELVKKGIEIPIKQAANSATIIDLPKMSMNMVRPGIMMYGLRPSPEVDEKFSLKPVLSWKTRIIYLKELSAGKGVSYGATYITPETRKIATLPLGYADGYRRLLSNRGEVLINGKRAPIRGRVCMDQFMVDVSDIKNVEVGDEAVLIGQQGKEEITATELADITGTINYEIVTGISKRVPRVYKN